MPDCDACLRTKITRAPCRRRTGEASIPRAEKFGDLTTADHNDLNEEGESRNNHRYAVVVQHSATLIRADQKLHRKEKNACGSSWSRRGNQKSFIVTSPWSLAKPVSTVDCRSSCWTASTLAHDQVKKWSKGKGTNLLGLSTMSWENEFFKRRSKRQMVQSSERVQDVLRSTRVLCNRCEKQLKSSGIFPRMHNIADFYRRSRKTCNARTWNQNDSLTGSYSCRCSTTLNGKREILKKLVFRNRTE